MTFLTLACCLGIWANTYVPVLLSPALDLFSSPPKQPLCPQADVLAPDAHRVLWDSMNAKISSPEFHASAVDWLAGAVRIP